MDKSSSEWKDRLGIVASALCAVHCAATPILLVFLPTLQFTEWMASPLFHQIAAVFCVSLVAISIVPAYRKHKDVRVLSFSGVGLAMILAAAFCLPDYCCEGGHHHGAHADVATSGNKPTAIQLVSLSSSKTNQLAAAGESTSSSKCSDGNCSHNHAAKPVAVTKSSCSHEGCTHSHGSSKSVAKVNDTCCSNSDSGCCDEASAQEDDVLIAGFSSKFWSVVQPWMTPIGGLLLMIAHGLNMKRSLGGCSTRCGCDSKSRDELDTAIQDA